MPVSKLADGTGAKSSKKTADVDDASIEHDARHRAKLSGAQVILQSELSSSPDATINFGEERVDTRHSSHVATKPTLQQAADAGKEENAKTNSSKASAKAKAMDGQQSDIEFDDNGFKIPRSRAKHHKKKIEVTEHLRIVAKLLAWKNLERKHRSPMRLHLIGYVKMNGSVICSI